MSEIHEAVEQGELLRVQTILATNPTQVHALLDEKTRDQPLHLAAWQNHMEIAALLIATGADVNARGEHGRTPLHYSAFHGSTAVARRLIGNHANLNMIDEFGFTPLFTAARSRNRECQEVVNLLLANGATLDINTAICIGDLEHLQALLANDPDAIRTARFPNDLIYDAVIYIGSRLLEATSELPANIQNVLKVINMYRPLLDFLIANGANVDSIGFSGWPALFEAVQMEHIAIAQTRCGLGGTHEL